MSEPNENNAALPACSSSAADPQTRIANMQKGLLGGRGPGATSEELAPYMHDRVILASIPATVERELVADQTQLARGEKTEQVQHKIDQQRDHLTLTVAQIVDRLAPEQMAKHLTRTTRRRVETLLDIPRIVADEAPPSVVPLGKSGSMDDESSGGSARSIADPRWTRLFVSGMAVGAAIVLGVGAYASKRHRERLARQAIARRYLP